MPANITIQSICVPNSESANITLVVFLVSNEALPFSTNFFIRNAAGGPDVYNRTFVFTDTSPIYDYITLPNGTYKYFDNNGFEIGEFTINCIVLPPCDLNIVSATPTPDKNGTGSGAITINATSSYALEYSKNQVTWQSSNILTGYTSGTYTVYVRDANSCHAEKTNVTIINTPCDISISSTVKTDETGEDLNNGTITVVGSSSSGPVQYNLDGGSYQLSGSFTGLAPGIHTVYLLDAVGCTTFTTFTIAEFVPEVIPPEEIPCFDPLLIIPEINPYRFVLTHCNEAHDTESLFMDDDNCGVYKPCYFQPLNCNDVLTFQFYYFEGEYSTVPFVVIKNFITKLPLYTLTPTHLGSGYYQVEKNVNEISNICEKKVYLEIHSGPATGDVDLYTHAVSDPIHISARHNCNVLLQYWNDKNYEGIIYEGSGYVNQFRLNAIVDEEELPQETEVYRKSNGELVKISEIINEVWQIEVDLSPFYIHKKIALALSHDHVLINGKEFVKEEPYSFERVPKYALRKGLGKLSAKTTQYKNLIK